MKKTIIFSLLVVFVCLFSANSYAGPHYLNGNIIGITSIPIGLMIRLENNAVPDNCQGSPYGWMYIPEQYKTMIALALMAYSQGNKNVTVYTDNYSGAGYCSINQFDPN